VIFFTRLAGNQGFDYNPVDDDAEKNLDPHRMRLNFALR